MVQLYNRKKTAEVKLAEMTPAPAAAVKSTKNVAVKRPDFF
jgi:hypothetical protein